MIAFAVQPPRVAQRESLSIIRPLSSRFGWLQLPPVETKVIALAGVPQPRDYIPAGGSRKVFSSDLSVGGKSGEGASSLPSTPL